MSGPCLSFGPWQWAQGTVAVSPWPWGSSKVPGAQSEVGDAYLKFGVGMEALQAGLNAAG